MAKDNCERGLAQCQNLQADPHLVEINSVVLGAVKQHQCSPAEAQVLYIYLKICFNMVPLSCSLACLLMPNVGTAA